MLNGVKHLLLFGETLPSAQSDTTFWDSPFNFVAVHPSDYFSLDRAATKPTNASAPDELPQVSNSWIACTSLPES